MEDEPDNPNGLRDFLMGMSKLDGTGTFAVMYL